MSLLSEIIELEATNYGELEAGIEKIRNRLLNKEEYANKDYLQGLGNTIQHISPELIIQILRVVEVLLEVPYCQNSAAGFIILCLKHGDPEVRYTALEAIQYGLGDVKIADDLLTCAKDVLRNESNFIVKDYLRLLSNANIKQIQTV
jgi:hypothetical protein